MQKKQQQQEHVYKARYRYNTLIFLIYSQIEGRH